MLGVNRIEGKDLRTISSKKLASLSAEDYISGLLMCLVALAPLFSIFSNLWPSIQGVSRYFAFFAGDASFLVVYGVIRVFIKRNTRKNNTESLTMGFIPRTCVLQLTLGQLSILTAIKFFVLFQCAQSVLNNIVSPSGLALLIPILMVLITPHVAVPCFILRHIVRYLNAEGIKLVPAELTANIVLFVCTLGFVYGLTS